MVVLLQKSIIMFVPPKIILLTYKGSHLDVHLKNTQINTQTADSLILRPMCLSIGFF